MMPPLRVLVVEDDAPTLGYLCALLAGWGYLVDPVRDGSA
jgi:CheY-like chemotaxis protein